MVKFSASIQRFNFDIRRYTEKAEEALLKTLKRAAREYLKAVLPRIPTRSGFLKGAFRPLQDFLGVGSGVSGVTKRITPKVDLKEYYQGILKTPFSGTRFATPPEEAFKKLGNLTYEFVYAIDIVYYVVNDIQIPWDSVEAGTKAFKNYLEERGFDDFPDPLDFFNVNEVKIG